MPMENTPLEQITAAHFSATDVHISARVEFPASDGLDRDAVVAPAAALAAMFPKSTRVYASTCTGPVNGSYLNGSQVWGQLLLDVKLSADGTNGGRNETGLKRWRSFKRTCGRLGIELEYRKPYSNSLTDEEAAAL